jgi:hypothetical protein
VVWKKGTSGNPAGAQPGRSQNKGGRPKGSKNRGYYFKNGEWVPKGEKTEWEPRVVEPGDDLDCLDYCQSVVSSPSMPHRDRMTAAAILAPFRHLKPQGRFLSRHIDLDPPKDIDEAIEQRKKLMALKRVGYLSIEDANDQIAEIDGLINVMRGPDQTQRIELLEAQARGEGDTPQIEYIVESALGTMLPGCNIALPESVKVIDTRPKEEEAPDDSYSGSCCADSAIRSPDAAKGGENKDYWWDPDAGGTSDDAAT